MIISIKQKKEGLKMKKFRLKDTIYLCVIFLLVAATVILSVLLFRKTEMQEKSYYTLKCESFAVQNANLSKGQIVFVGDSITDLYPLDSYYSDLPLAAYNRGIGGDTTTGVLKRMDVSLFDLAPSKIVLMIGTNDVNVGESVDSILERYEKILDQIKEKLPNAELYCMSIIPQNYDRDLVSEDDVDGYTEKILQLNPEIKRLSEKKGASYVDLFSPLADDSLLLKKEYSDDGLHLNSKGFRVWTDILKPLIAN